IAILPTPARHAADPDSPALLTLPSSTPMIELAKRGSWYYIRTFNGTPAWVHKNTVAPVSQ
ncbi:MAG: SH3 domain-containing protein, partial [Akkermansia sp.]